MRHRIVQEFSPAQNPDKYSWEQAMGILALIQARESKNKTLDYPAEFGENG